VADEKKQTGDVMRGLLLTVVSAAALVGPVAACHHRPAEGPGEKAGRAVDDAARKTGDAAKDAAHDTKKDLDGR
jgi:hypothetical protein